MTSLTPLTVETIVKEFETLGVKTFNGVDDEDLVPILDIVETVYDEDGNEMHITKWLTEKFTTLTTQHTKEKEESNLIERKAGYECGYEQGCYDEKRGLKRGHELAKIKKALET